VALWILDTDHLSLLQRGNSKVAQRISSINPNDIAITIITAEKQLYGRLNSIRRSKSPENLQTAYQWLQETLNDFRSINILGYDLKAINLYQQLKLQKIRIGTQDLKIALL
jgi:tRNA(fMet)-specific endonuclease VapC